MRDWGRHPGPKGRRGASEELVKSMCCAIRVEQGNIARVPLCTGQARIEQRSKHIAQRGGQTQHLLVGESLLPQLTILLAWAAMHAGAAIEVL